MRIELRDPDGIHWDDTKVDYAINQAYRKVFQKVAAALEDYFVTTDTADIVSGTRTYALPSDFLRLKSLEYVQGNLTVPLTRHVRGYSINFTSGSSYSSVAPYFTYDFEGDYLVIEPTPNDSVTDGFKYTYYQTSTPLSISTDTIHSNFKDIWVDVLVLEAARACMSQIDGINAIVSSDIIRRLEEAQEAMELSLSLRTLSPKKRRRKGYFQ